MLLPEIAPLAIETMIVGTIVVFTAAGVLGSVAGQLQRRLKISNIAAWFFFFGALWRPLRCRVTSRSRSDSLRSWSHTWESLPWFL